MQLFAQLQKSKNIHSSKNKTKNKIKMKNLKALVKTKSNYRNLNGKWVTVKQFIGNIVYCGTFCELEQKDVTFDLYLNEIEKIKEFEQ